MNNSCPLCVEIQKNEHVLKKSENFLILFNRYPYTSGHLMVVSKKHTSNTLGDLTKEERAELIEVINDTQQRLLQVMKTDSVNIGLNSGPFSGASIPEHFHVHIVSRIENDIGFYNIVCKSVTQGRLQENREIWRIFREN